MKPAASAALAAGMAALLLSPVAVGVPIFGPAEAVAGERQSVYDTAAADAATAAEAEDAALMTASNGRALSPDALEYLRARLGL